jgi:hypothetical protein
VKVPNPEKVLNIIFKKKKYQMEMDMPDLTNTK